jgi:segregation and condensation protein B
MSENSQEKSKSSLEEKIEALFFVSPSPISITQFSNTLSEKPKTVEEALNHLKEFYQNSRGIRIEENKGRFQITTAPELAEVVENYLGQEETTSLSQAALEALAIVAYRQPITRPDVDEIRGVNSDGVIRNLLNKGLIQEVGRNEGSGRAILYGTTSDFLQYFGLSTLKELPQIDVTPGENNGAVKILKD